MKINIITVMNGVGLEKDARVLKAMLKGHTVNLIDSQRHKGRNPFADLSIHLEILYPQMMRLARRNVFIPNPEWYYDYFDPLLEKCNEVWTKTHDATQIFQQKHTAVRYLGFTTGVKFTDGEKSKVFLHIAGKSSNKGTAQVIRAFKQTTLPLYILAAKHYDVGMAKNIAQSNGYLPQETVDKLIQDCLFHVCTSEYEGYGHYIHEGLSSGIVLTTDAPPMNEFVTDPRLLIEVECFTRQRLANLAHILVDDLRQKALNLINLPNEELINMIARNRQTVQKRHFEFAERLKEYVG
jgi:hypothetical protein